MPKDDKQATMTPPKELPMPKYGYQRSHGGSVSSAYKSDDARKAAPAHSLQNITFG